jgi:hypothetical protein
MTTEDNVPAPVALAGCALTVLTAEMAETWAAWAFGTAAAPDAVDDLTVAVAQCADTLAWGVREAGGWLWASDPVVDAGVRPPTRGALLELRLFGTDREILLWCERPGAERLHGRVLSDAPEAHPDLAPIDRHMGFDQRSATPETIGDSRFVLRRSGSGRIVVTPPGKVLVVRNYVEELPETGLLRIAASRFRKFQ